jgi:CheY-like chemotaxis protein
MRMSTSLRALLLTSYLYPLLLNTPQDLQMPVLDGLETTRRIRTMEAGTTSRTPIIGITASVSEQDRAVCLGVGMDSFLSKPIKREHLLRILREWTAGPDKNDP